MEIRVHRDNLWQVGGCVTDIRTNSTRIVIDFGLDLPMSPGLPAAEVPRLDGLNTGRSGQYHAVFFTHYHLDHIGAINQIHPDIPLYMGQTAVKLFRLSCRHHARGMVPAALRVQGLAPLVPIGVGDIVVTPIPCDHSAYDSMMYLVQSGGIKVLHSGDFRMHGFLGKATAKLLKKHVGKVDALILEGTNLGAFANDAVSEVALQQQIRPVLREHPYCFVLCSSSHIQRLASFCNATPKGRYFVCDTYQKQVFDTVSASAFSHWFGFKKALTYGDNLRLKERGFVMPVRANERFVHLMEPFMDKAVLIYSLWSGYLEDPNSPIARLTAPFRQAGRMITLHTSGHADLSGLRQMVALTDPDIVIPIHSEIPQEMRRVVTEEKLELFLGGDCLYL